MPWEVNNTFNARLHIAAEQLLPQIRAQMFTTGAGLDKLTGV
jgi:vacuolar-type H+-ATPase subunit E/Vma4